MNILLYSLHWILYPSASLNQLQCRWFLWTLMYNILLVASMTVYTHWLMVFACIVAWKKCGPGCLEQVDFTSAWATFHSHFPDGQGIRQLMLCLHLSFYHGKNWLRSSYLTLVHLSSVYTGWNNLRWSVNTRTHCISNIMKSNWQEIPKPYSLQEVKWWLLWPLFFFS